MRRWIRMVVPIVLLAACGGVQDESAGSELLPADQPCMDIDEDGMIAPVGLSQQELEHMVISEPAWMGFEEGAEIGDWDGAGGGYITNSQTGLQMLPPSACEVLRDFGRVIGFRRSTMGTEGWIIASAVHVFRDEQGAAAFVDWYPYTLQPGDEPMPGIVWETADEQPVPELGTSAKLVTAGDEWVGQEVEQILVPTGRYVVDVWFGYSFGDERPAADLVTLAQYQLDLVADSHPTGAPYDITTLMSAALPLAAYGPGYADYVWASSTAGCMGSACGCSAGYAVADTMQMSPEMQPEMPTEGVVRVSSGVQGYWSPEQASAEFRLGQESVDPWGTPSFEDVTELPEAYSTGCCGDSTVVFTHGPFIAWVTITDAAEGVDHTQEAIDRAVQLDERLSEMFDS